jgi:CheY-like chemotaxis protein
MEGQWLDGYITWVKHPIAPAGTFSLLYQMMTEKNISAAGAPASAPIECQPNSRQRILVVEDDAAIRRINTEVLTYSGYQVDAAEDGAAAWDAVQLNNYDLIVTDNDMPKVTGIELIQKLQDARMDLPVVMATGAMPDEPLRYTSLQPAIILLKPYTFDELLEAVKTVLCACKEGCEAMVPPSDWRVRPMASRFQP